MDSVNDSVKQVDEREGTLHKGIHDKVSVLHS